MKAIALVMFLVMTIQTLMPMATVCQASTETSAPISTFQSDKLALSSLPGISFSAITQAAVPGSTFDTTVGSSETYTIETALDASEVSDGSSAAEEENTDDDIIYLKLVKAKQIDTSKPYLQKASGTLAASRSYSSAYPLTAEERDLIERVVMTEIGGGAYTDKLAVAQCIYDRITAWGRTVKSVLYQANAFASPSSKTPVASVKQAVADVFDNGRRVTVEPIYYFIATGSAKPGCFHETQRCLYATKYHRYYGKW